MSLHQQKMKYNQIKIHTNPNNLRSEYSFRLLENGVKLGIVKNVRLSEEMLDENKTRKGLLISFCHR